jgi:hypothetical protein
VASKNKTGEEQLQFIRNAPNRVFMKFFAIIAKDYIETAVDVFPKTASMVTNAEHIFSITRMRKVRNAWHTEFISLVSSILRFHAVLFEVIGFIVCYILAFKLDAPGTTPLHTMVVDLDCVIKGII